MVSTALEKPHMVMNHESVRFCSTSAKVLRKMLLEWLATGLENQRVYENALDFDVPSSAM